MSFDAGEERRSVSAKIKEEIDSWRSYTEALREEDRLVFRDMLNLVVSTYSEAIGQAERGYDTESLLISIILSQQKSINWLSNLARRLQQESEARRKDVTSRSAIH